VADKTSKKKIGNLDLATKETEVMAQPGPRGSKRGQTEKMIFANGTALPRCVPGESEKRMHG